MSRDARGAPRAAVAALSAAAAALAVLASLVPCSLRAAPQALTTWRWADGRVTPDDEGAGEPRSVGSLQKAWLVEAWALSHPEAPLPIYHCRASSRCWLRGGHGRVDLRSATSHSCNAYFRQLALETPANRIASALSRAGFDVAGPLSADAAIGLEPRAVTITPRALLAAYAALVVTPWPARDDARREWLAGMADSGARGTASRLAVRGLLAKTGTVAAETAPRTSGWALVLDPTGVSGALAFLPRGTGGDAAAALGEVLLAERPWAAARSSEARTPGGRAGEATHRATARGEILAAPSVAAPAVASRSAALPGRSARGPAPALVRVRLLSALSRFDAHAKNVGAAPAARGGRDAGYVGPGAEVALMPGVTLGAARWEIRLPGTQLLRIVDGALEARRAAAGTSLVLTATARDYVEGVIRGELPSSDAARAEELAAAVLRFLAEGARHGTEDVCDLSHCARFVGLGPPVAWPRATRAQTLASWPRFDHPLDAAGFARAEAAARAAGPSSWTAHCGGQPLSPHAVWGHGSLEAPACPRHGGDASAPWTRTLSFADARALFGDDAELTAAEREGFLLTRVTAAGAERLLPYDEVHRLIASRAGWDALPSPPDEWTRTPNGWLARGRGFGHRVGLCLAD